MTDPRPVDCPLCDGVCRDYAKDRKRHYIQCADCQLVLASPEARLSPAQEKAEYEKHENVSTDAGYRRFVERLFAPMTRHRGPPAKVLDFGSGKSSALAALFRESGYEVFTFDPFFDPEECVLQPGYDLIVLSEVLEHLFYPKKELRRLWSLLNPGGLLGVQTQRLLGPERFAAWRYKDDPTHVAFYSEHTFSALSASLGARLELLPRDVALFTKKGSDT